MDRSTEILKIIATRKSAGEPFVLATVVRTVAATAAKACPGSATLGRAAINDEIRAGTMRAPLACIA